MNCKPGDLAVIVTVLGSERSAHALGKIIKVESSTTLPDGHPSWFYSPPIYDPLTGDAYWTVLDACLKPIRGNDTSDPRLVKQDLDSRVKAVTRRLDAARKERELRDRFDSESA